MMNKITDRRKRASLRLWMVAAVTAVVAMFIGAGPAWAHNSLVSAAPAKDAVLAQPPATVTLKFLATLQPKGALLTVTGPDGAAAIGPATVAGKTISAPFTGSAAGAYTVGYQVSSSDGHQVKGSYHFTIAAGPSPSGTPTTQRQPESMTTRNDAQLSPVGAAQDTSGITPWWVYICGGAVAGLLLGMLLAFIRRRRGGDQ